PLVPVSAPQRPYSQVLTLRKDYRHRESAPGNNRGLASRLAEPVRSTQRNYVRHLNHLRLDTGKGKAMNTPCSKASEVVPTHTGSLTPAHSHRLTHTGSLTVNWPHWWQAG